MPDYQKGKIYKLWSPHGNEIYIGSTINTLAKRLDQHKKTYIKYSSKYLFENYDDVRIELIEEYPCNNKMELNKKEGEHIRNNECLNKYVAGRTQKEYREDNKEYLNKKNQENKKLPHNKEKIKDYKEVIITCECGCELRRDTLNRHKKSNKHLNRILSNNTGISTNLNHISG